MYKKPKYKGLFCLFAKSATILLMHKRNKLATRKQKVLLLHIGGYALVVVFVILDLIIINGNGCTEMPSSRFGGFFQGCYSLSQLEFWLNNWYLLGFAILWTLLIAHFWLVDRKNK
jgi:hypothetical protein